MSLPGYLPRHVAEKLRECGDEELKEFADEVEGYPPFDFWDRFFEEAVRKVSMESLRKALVALATDHDAAIRYNVIKRIPDVKTLLQLIKRADAEVKCELVEIIEDREKLALIARELVRDSDPLVRREIVQRIRDEATLARLARDSDPLVREAVALTTSDEEILEMLSHDPEPIVREVVARRARSEKVLRRLLNDDVLAVKSTAKERMRKLGYKV